MNMKNSRNIAVFLLLAGLGLAFLACGTDPEPTVTGVTVSPSNTSVTKGETQQFRATVTGTKNPAQAVTWEVSGNSTISADGLLTVAADETADTLTVTATSTADTSKSGTATVTVTGNSSSNILTGTVIITGTAQVGQPLTANTDNLDGSGTISYQWKRGDSAAAEGTDITGATSATYTLVAADENKYITVTVTREGYTDSITSNELGPIIAAGVALPTVSTVTVNSTATSVAKGQTLQFTVTVVGTNSPSQTVNWTIVETNKKAGTSIDTSGKLTVASDETLTKLTVKATSTVDSTKSGTKEVTVTTSSLPALSGSVSITGTAIVGQQLTANTGSLQGSGTISYQWIRIDSATTTTGTNIGTNSTTYTLAAADLGKYIKLTVTRTGNSDNVTSNSFGPVHQTGTGDSTSSLSSVSGATTTVTEGSRTGILKVDASKLDWMVATYNLSSYKGKEITIILSVDVKREGAAGDLNWQINNNPGYPSVAIQNNAAAGTWYSMSGTWKGTPTDNNAVLYLSNDKKSGTTFFYIDNFTITIIDGSSGGGGDGGVQTITANGMGALSGSPYHYEMWTEGGSGNKLIWYGPTERGGAAFRAEWNEPNDYLGRIGYYWGNGGLFTTYKNLYADFTYTRSGRNTAGNYSYIGIYGWSRNPSAADSKEQLIEYYIVEDWFGNQWQDDNGPMGTGTTQGTVMGSYTLDGATYSVHKSVRTNAPSIDGNKTFTQYFSIRQTLRKTGTISITEHFKKWDEMNMKLGNMYECKFLVEAGAGTGWLEFSNLKFSQEDTPRP
jgi:endo-1,4-beta-xylanase